jgi:pilus assembly protein Flp/PilA
MCPILTRFCEDETAATPIEYGVIAALVAILIVGTLRLVGAYLGSSVSGVSQALSGGSGRPN